MQALAASCEELHARTGNPPLDNVYYNIRVRIISDIQTLAFGSSMLAQRGQNYKHVHIISITQISFSYVQISVSIQIRRS